jgi:hypothetical protein
MVAEIEADMATQLARVREMERNGCVSSKYYWIHEHKYGIKKFFVGKSKE